MRYSWPQLEATSERALLARSAGWKLEDEDERGTESPDALKFVGGYAGAVVPYTPYSSRRRPRYYRFFEASKRTRSRAALSPRRRFKRARGTRRVKTPLSDERLGGDVNRARPCGKPAGNSCKRGDLAAAEASLKSRALRQYIQRPLSVRTVRRATKGAPWQVEDISGR